MNKLNSANETLRIIRQQKAILTKKKEEAIKWIETQYQEDIKILNEEEKELLKQFKDIPGE